MFDKEKFRNLLNQGYEIFKLIKPNLSKEEKDKLMKEAENIYLKIIKINPRHAESYYHLGIIAGHFKDFTLSAEYLAQASCYNPSKKEEYDRIVKSYYYTRNKPEKWQNRAKNIKTDLIEIETPLEEVEPTEEEIMTLEELEEIEKFKEKNLFTHPLTEIEKNITRKETEIMIGNISNLIFSLEPKKRIIIE